MTFPDGTMKEGYFENNVYKIKVQVQPHESNDPQVQQMLMEQQNSMQH